MEARGAVALLAVALVAWFARIPFEPTPGVPASGVELTINLALVGIFIVAVEGLVFGLIPLSFLPGQRIWAWSRWRWLVLWGAGLALFVHVLVFPVTVAQPNPDPTSLTATLVSVGIYGLIAVGFWLFFRWHNARPAPEAVAAPEPAAPRRAPSGPCCWPRASSPRRTFRPRTPTPRTKRPRKPKATAPDAQPTDDIAGGQGYTGDDTGPEESAP